MSANSRDASPDFRGPLKEVDAPAPADLTEDLADEITSELDPPPRWTSPAPAPVAEYAAANDGMAGHPAETSGEGILRERYVLEARLGSGGTAIVYRAIDLRRDAAATDGRHVAVKMLRTELRDRPQNIARLQREFRQTRAIAHPNIVRFHDLDCDRGSWFIVMELLTGETLGSRLRRNLPAGLPRSEALRIAAAVGDALSHAHALGVTHGDVKPGNIFLTAAGEVRLLDFGAAPGSAVTSQTDVPPAAPVAAAATRVYASPDVLAGEEPGPLDDVFSLACVIYEMLTGLHPYGRRGADAVLGARITPQPVATLDASRWSALAAGLDLSHAARPAAAELLRSLQRGSGPVDSAGPAVDRAAPAPGWARRIVLGLIAAALALAFAILIGRFNSGPGQAPAARAPSQAAAVTAAPAPEPADGMPPNVAEPVTPPEVIADEPVTPPGIVSFDAPTMIVSKRAVLAAIPLRHLNRAKRAVEVNWRVIDGSARLGRDYGGAPGGVESFVEGNTFRILYVPIVTDAAATRDRTFIVELTDTSPGATLGANRRIEVTILGGA